MSYVIHNVHGSNFANAMMKYMAAKKLQSEIPGGVLSNYHLPWWNIEEPEIPRSSGIESNCVDEHTLPLSWLKYIVRSGVDRINIHGHVQRMDNFPSWEMSNLLFKAPTDAYHVVRDDAFVCPVRGGEILKAIHPGYTLLPIKFYQEIQKRYLKPLIFMGQLGDNPYANALRKAFPDSVYLPHISAMHDFQTIRNARNIVVPISTFAWLAAWMSSANKIILPVFGLFDTARFPGSDLLPIFDRRYDFYKFDIQDSVDVEFVLKAHEILNWKYVDQPLELHTV